MSSTARYSECASTGCSVAKAIFTRVEPVTDTFCSNATILVTIHAPKHETFDLAARTNTDPKGIVRAVGPLHGAAHARPRPVSLHGVVAAAVARAPGNGVPLQSRARTRSGLLPRRRPVHARR